MKNFIELKEINTQHTQNLWDTVRTVLRGKFIALCDYIKKNWRDVIQKKPKTNKTKLNSIPESSRTKALEESSRRKLQKKALEESIPTRNSSHEINSGLKSIKKKYKESM